jgi:hypothetical protein
MEFLQWLKNEHQTVRQLLQKLPEAEERTRVDLFREVRMELLVHHRLEEKYVYPLGEGYAPTRQLAEHAIEETHKTEEMLDQMDPSEEQFEAQLEELTQMIEDHVEEEEQELVPQLMEDVPSEQQDQLVRKLQQAKRQEMQAAQ